MESSEPFWRRHATALDEFLRTAQRQGSVSSSQLSAVLPDNPDVDDVEGLFSMLDALGVVVEDDE